MLLFYILYYYFNTFFGTQFFSIIFKTISYINNILLLIISTEIVISLGNLIFWYDKLDNIVYEILTKASMYAFTFIYSEYLSHFYYNYYI